MDYNQAVEVIEEYVQRVCDLIQYPTEIDLVVDDENETKLDGIKCAAAIRMFSLREQRLIVGKQCVLWMMSDNPKDVFEAELTICHELIHGLMHKSLEITQSLIKNEALDISIERDTDLVAERLANLVRMIPK